MQVEKRLDSLEIAVKKATLSPKPREEELFRMAMRVLAEEEKLEQMLEKAKTKEEKRKIEAQLKRVKRMRRQLLNTYAALAIRAAKGGWKQIPLITKLGKWGEQ